MFSVALWNSLATDFWDRFAMDGVLEPAVSKMHIYFFIA